MPERAVMIRAALAILAVSAVAEVLRTGLAPRLSATGVPVKVRTVHPLPSADSRGLVGFYTVVGWVVGASVFSLGLIVALGFGQRRGALTEEEAEASMGMAAAP